MDGAHRTPVRVKSITRLRESRTESGRTPMATHGRGFPSTPDTDSEQAFKFIRSCMYGCMWYVHPLSTTKPMCLPFVRRLRVCLSLRRAERVAIRAPALEAMRRSMRALCSALRSRPDRLSESTSGLLAWLSALRDAAMPLGAEFAEADGFASCSKPTTHLVEAKSRWGCAIVHARRASIKVASVR
eukprot:3837735-Pleurochrysis_carterae.AAC.1